MVHMKNFYMMLIGISFLGTIVAAKQAPVPPKRKVNVKKILNTKDIQSNAFINQMVRKVPKMMCEKDSKLMRCHKIRTKECKNLVKAGVSQCLKIARIPRKISSVGVLRQSEQLGLCLRKRVNPKIKNLRRTCRAKKN